MDRDEADQPESKPTTDTGGIQFGDHSQVHGDVFSGGKRVVNTSGGSHVEGDMNVGGDYVGGNKTVTQHAGGDIVGRDIITTTTQGLSDDQALKLAAAFAAIQQQIDARPPDPNVETEEIKRAVEDVHTEVQKGEAANPNKVERWLTNLGRMAPDILKVTAATLASPVAGIATAIQLIAKKAQEK
jgi:hypothetical protein